MPLVGQVFKRTRQLTSAIKDAGRLKEIVSVLVKNGFGYLLDNVNIPGIGRVRARREELDAVLSAPERALRVISDLGPTYVKVGQILSTRPDLVPSAFVDAFQTLQDHVSPLPSEVIIRQLKQALQAEPENLFERFDSEPLASASIAQVHRARLKTGEEVVLKIRRPGVRVTILTDLEIMAFLARQIERNFPETMLIDLSGIVREIEQSIRAETDFLIEAGNLHRVEQNFKNDANVVIPRVFKQFTTSEVLTMEYLDGVKITKAAEQGRDMTVIGRHYLDASYQMLFKDGFFHGDLHPGNVIVLANDALGFIDFGMVGRLTPEMKNNVVDCMFGLMTMDFKTIARIFWDIGIKDESVSHSRFEADVVDVMERHLVGKSIGDLQMGLFFRDILDGAMRHRIRVPTGYTMLFKALVTTEGMARMLVPDINPLEVSRPFVEALIKDRYSLERLGREYHYHLAGFARLADRLPLALSQLITDLTERQLRIQVDLNPTPPHRQEKRRQEDRRIMAMLSTGAMVAGGLSLTRGEPIFLGAPLWSLLFFAGAFVLGALLFLGYPRGKS